MKIADILLDWPHKSIILDYDEFYSEVMKCVKSGALSAVNASHTNGRSRPLFKKYRITIIKQTQDFQEKIRFLHPSLLKNGWLLSHMEKYTKWQQELMALNNFFGKFNLFVTSISKKERSYQIFGEEKRLEDREFSALFHRIE